MLQKDLIEKEECDVLVILDGARYDIFSEIYRSILYPYKTQLLKVESLAPEGTWCQVTFTRKYNVDYYSANPHVINKFRRIIRIWESGWDMKLGTVPPWNVNWSVLNDQNRSERFIVHYLQPHGTWIGKHKLYTYWTNNVGLGQDTYLRQYLKMKSREEVQQLYIDNLILVMRHVVSLIDALDKDVEVVITSDHGEHLGEEGKYLHTPMWNTPIIKNVPWCVVKCVES